MGPQVALALTSETDVRKLAGIILGKSRLLSRGDRSALFLLDESTRELVEFAYDGGGEVELRENGIRVQIGRHGAPAGPGAHARRD